MEHSAAAREPSINRFRVSAEEVFRKRNDVIAKDLPKDWLSRSTLFLSVTNGKDKLFKLIQHVAKLWSVLAGPGTARQSLDRLEDAMSQARKGFRYFKVLNEYQKLIHNKEQNPTVRMVMITGHCFALNYYWIDHLLLIVQMRLIRLSDDDYRILKRLKNNMSLGRILCSFVFDSIQLSSGEKRRRQIKWLLDNHLTDEAVTPSPSSGAARTALAPSPSAARTALSPTGAYRVPAVRSDAALEGSRQMFAKELAFYNARRAHLIRNTWQNLCNLIIVLHGLYPTQHRGRDRFVIGLLGSVSAYIDCVKVAEKMFWGKNFKSPPKPAALPPQAMGSPVVLAPLVRTRRGDSSAKASTMLDMPVIDEEQ